MVKNTLQERHLNELLFTVYLLTQLFCVFVPPGCLDDYVRKQRGPDVVSELGPVFELLQPHEFYWQGVAICCVPSP